MTQTVTKRIACFTMLVGLAAACGGIKIDSGAQAAQPGDNGTTNALPDVTNQPAPSDNSSDVVSSGTDASTKAGTAAEICAAKEQTAPYPSTQALFQQQLLRTWLLCDKPSIFGTSDEAGLEIEAGGRWYKVFERADGTLDRGVDLNQGSWEIIDTSVANGRPSFQLNLTNSLKLIIVHPEFSVAPLKMRVSNNGVFTATYAAQGEQVPVTAGETEVAVTYPPNACPLPGQPVPTPAAPDAFTTTLVGRWLTCQGSIFFNSKEVGLEFAVGGTFYKLYPGTTPGTVVRAHGFGEEGTWSLLVEGGGPIQPYIQLNLALAGGGEIFLLPNFTVSPRKMHLYNEGNSDYAID
jgi:hypothetical protein